MNSFWPLSVVRTLFRARTRKACPGRPVVVVVVCEAFGNAVAWVVQLVRLELSKQVFFVFSFFRKYDLWIL